MLTSAFPNWLDDKTFNNFQTALGIEVCVCVCVCESVHLKSTV